MGPPSSLLPAAPLSFSPFPPCVAHKARQNKIKTSTKGAPFPLARALLVHTRAAAQVARATSTLERTELLWGATACPIEIPSGQTPGCSLARCVRHREPEGGTGINGEKKKIIKVTNFRSICRGIRMPPYHPVVSQMDGNNLFFEGSRDTVGRVVLG